MTKLQLYLVLGILIGGLLYLTRKKISKIMTRGYMNNNPGNIDKTFADLERTKQTFWKGEIVGKDKRFKSFVDMPHGYRAIFVLLHTYMKLGKNTIQKMIDTYAPPIENNTSGYVTVVEQKSGKNRTTILTETDVPTLKLIVAAISRVENGTEPDMNLINEGYNLFVHS